MGDRCKKNTENHGTSMNIEICYIIRTKLIINYALLKLR